MGVATQLAQGHGSAALLKLPGFKFLELQSNPGQLSSHPGVYININVSCSVKKSQQELVSMNCSVSVGVAVSACCC